MSRLLTFSHVFARRGPGGLPGDRGDADGVHRHPGDNVMTPAEFNVLAERACATLHVDHVEALRDAAKLIRKGSLIGVYSKQPAWRDRYRGVSHPEREHVIPAVLVSFDGDMHATACETDEAHRMRLGFEAAKTAPKPTTEVFLYALRALPGTRFKGSPRRR